MSLTLLLKPLHRAAFWGRKEGVLKQTQKGVGLNSKDFDG